MGKLGLFLTRRQIAYIQRLLITNPPPTTPEYRDLLMEVKAAYELVQASYNRQWADYEFDQPDLSEDGYLLLGRIMEDGRPHYEGHEKCCGTPTDPEHE